MAQTRIVISLVEVLQHAREDFRLFIGEFDASGWVLDVAVCSHRWVEGLCLAERGEEVRDAEDGFVCGEEALFGADA